MNLAKTQMDAQGASDFINQGKNSVAGDGSSLFGDAYTLTSSDFNTTNGKMSWFAATAWAAQLTFGGPSGWRLPGITGGFNLVERVLNPDGTGNLIIFLSCSIKSHDIAFAEYPEPGKLHHCSFLMESWDAVLRAGDIMSMNKVSVDIGPTRHGVTRGCTIYAWDPSGNRFETFKEDRQPYPDHEPLTWTFEAIGSGGGLDYVRVSCTKPSSVW